MQTTRTVFYEDWRAHAREIVEKCPDVSFVMPAFNEENNIMRAVKELSQVARQLGLKYELIVVDDGSFDSTLTKVTDYANGDSCVKVVSCGRNMGKGFAVKTGFCNAKGNNVVFIDSDLDIDPNQIDKYLKVLKYAEMVVGSKWHPQSNVQIRSIRRFLSQSFNLLVRLLTGARITDTQTGLKAVRRGALEKTFCKLIVKRYAFDVELLTVANRDGIKAVELPVDLQLPAMFRLREAWRMFIDLLGIAYRLRIRKFY